MVIPGKVHLDGKDYDSDDFSPAAKTLYEMLLFASYRYDETENNLSLLRRAKNSYVKELKKEMLSSKTGILFEDN